MYDDSNSNPPWFVALLTEVGHRKYKDNHHGIEYACQHSSHNAGQVIASLDGRYDDGHETCVHY